jgi:hypothetical protein
MQVTKHAAIRFQQRGINRIIIDYLLRYGDSTHAPGGALKISLTRKNKEKIVSSLKNEIKKIERSSRIVLIEKDNSILTAYHK